jgi:glucosamine 6-phosphate synthetase-like amidotransferase/phosphosugar isomerase protein
MTNYRKEYSFEKMENNTLYQISDNCTVSKQLLAKKLSIERQPKRGFSHIFEEEIFESVDAVNQVIDFGAKFI